MEARRDRGAALMAVLEAPIGAIGAMRRPLRLGHVLVSLEDLLIVTWRIREAELGRHLPAPLTPLVCGGDALMSVVLFRNRSLRPAVVGWPRIDSFQMNVRSYVVDPATGLPGSVFFHGLYLSRRWLADLSSRMFNVPFQHLPLSVASRVEHDRLVGWEARGPNGQVMLRAEEADVGIDAEVLDLLTNPHTAYFLDRRGTLRHWSIWHRPQSVRTMSVTVSALPAATQFGAGEPVSALYVASIDYEVYLPPRAAYKPAPGQTAVQFCGK
jgi:hypothetical protein